MVEEPRGAPPGTGGKQGPPPPGLGLGLGLGLHNLGGCVPSFLFVGSSFDYDLVFLGFA